MRPVSSASPDPPPFSPRRGGRLHTVSLFLWPPTLTCFLPRRRPDQRGLAEGERTGTEIRFTEQQHNALFVGSERRRLWLSCPCV